MGGGLIALTSVGGYLGVALAAYRVHYIRTFKQYRLWQLEKPNADARLDYDYGYGYRHKRRKDCDYWEYFHATDVDKIQPPYQFLWPLLLLTWITWHVCKGVKQIIQPELNLPNTLELEKESKELDD